MITAAISLLLCVLTLVCSRFVLKRDTLLVAYAEIFIALGIGACIIWFMVVGME